MLAGCFGEDATEDVPQTVNDVYPEPWDRADALYNDQDIYARVSVNGSHAIDAVRSVYVPVPTITAADGGAGGGRAHEAAAAAARQVHEPGAGVARAPGVREPRL
mgnify:CR=1 FL=1